MSKEELICELKELQTKMDMLVCIFKGYQSKRVEKIETDEQIQEYKILKEIVKNLEEIL